MNLSRRFKLFINYDIPLKGNDKIVYDFIMKCCNNTITKESYFFINHYTENVIYVSYVKETKNLEICPYMIDYIKTYDIHPYTEDNYYNVMVKYLFEKKFNFKVNNIIPLWF